MFFGKIDEEVGWVDTPSGRPPLGASLLPRLEEEPPAIDVEYFPVADSFNSLSGYPDGFKAINAHLGIVIGRSNHTNFVCHHPDPTLEIFYVAGLIRRSIYRPSIENYNYFLHAFLLFSYLGIEAVPLDLFRGEASQKVFSTNFPSAR